MNICRHDWYSCSELPKPSALLSYCSKHDPSTLDHYLISTSWCPCIACICHGLHGNPAHVSTQMDSVLHAARHIVLDRLQVDSMFFFPQKWNIGVCVSPQRQLRRWPQPPVLTNARADKLKSNTFFFVVVVPSREKMFLWHLKLVFPQSDAEFSQRRWVSRQHLESCVAGSLTLCWRENYQ